MPAEEIGAVSVAIEGDFTPLEKDFQAAVAIAISQGKTLAEAIEASMPKLDSTPVTDAMSQVGAAAQQAAQQLGLFGSAEEQISTADVNGQLNLFATQLETVQGSLHTAEEARARMAAGLQQTPQAVQPTLSIFQQLHQQLTTNTEGFKEFAQGVDNFISRPLSFAGDTIKEFLLAMGPMGGIALAAAAGAAALGKEVFSLVEEFGAAAEATGNLADRLNISWHETRELEDMAKIAGVSVQSLGAASFRLAEALDVGSKQGQKIAASLQAIGVEGATSGELLTGFLQKLAQIPDDTQRITLAHEVLGRSSQQILPLIKNYDELQKSIRELGPAIGDQLAGDLQRADDSLDKLSISWNRFKEEIAAGAAPTIMLLVDDFRMLIVETSKLTQETIGNARALAGMVPPALVQDIREIGNALLWVHTTFNPFIAGVRGMISVLENFNLVAAAVSGKAASDMKTGIETMDKSIKGNLTKSLHDATTGSKEFLEIWKTSGGGAQEQINNIIAAQAKLSNGVRDAKAAYDTLNNAFRTGTALADGHKVTQEEVTRALMNLNYATKQVSEEVTKHTKATQQHIRTQREMSEVFKLIADELAVQLGAYHAAIAATAKYNAELDIFAGTIKRLSVLDYMNRQLSEAKVAFEKLPEPVASLDPILKAAADDMKILGDNTQAAAQRALDTSPYAKLEAALKALGITSVAEYGRIADEAQKNYEIVANSAGVAYSDVERASLKALEAQIEYSYQLGETTKAQYDDMVKYIKGKLDELDGDTKKSAQTRGAHERTLGQELQDINRKTFDGIERGLASSIVHLKGFDDLWKTLWQGLAQDLLQIMFKTLLDPLEKGIGAALGKITGIGSSAGGAAGGAAGGGGGIASALGSASSLTGIVTAISSVGTMISSIVGNFQNARLETTMNAVEESTRYLKIGLVTQADSLLNDAHVIRNTLTDMMKWNWDVATTYFQAMSVNLDKIVSMGGFGTKGASASASMAATGYAVHIDLSGANLSGDLTDQQVKRTFDRGFRMSKFGGALRPGVFPQ